MKTLTAVKLLAAWAFTKTVMEQYYSFFIYIPNNWNSLTIRNVTGELQACSAPDYWRTEANLKKICQLDGETYYLKAASPKSLKEAFARKFANHNLDIKAPDTELLYEANGVVHSYFGTPVNNEYYIASKAIAAFKAAVKLTGHYFFSAPAEVRSQFVQHIGEDGIAKFAVASTFYDDLNLNNWGFNSQGLVLIDVDEMPSQLSDFFLCAMTNIRSLSHKSLTLSLNNILKMKAIYQEMKQKLLPKVHPDVDMPKKTYHQLIDTYLEACDCTIAKIQSELPALSSNTPAEHINNLLLSSLHDAFFKYSCHSFRPQ